MTRRRTLLAAAAIAALVPLAACTAARRGRKEKRMSDDDEDSFSRVGPPDVTPVVFEGRRYEQVLNGEDLGLDQRTGYLAVVDAASGRHLAAIKVYHVPFDPDLEADVQDVMMVRLELQADQRRLLVENERGQRFFVAVDGHAVTPAP